MVIMVVKAYIAMDDARRVSRPSAPKTGNLSRTHFTRSPGFLNVPQAGTTSPPADLPLLPSCTLAHNASFLPSPSFSHSSSCLSPSPTPSLCFSLSLLSTRRSASSRPPGFLTCAASSSTIRFLTADVGPILMYNNELSELGSLLDCINDNKHFVDRQLADVFAVEHNVEVVTTRQQVMDKHAISQTVASLVGSPLTRGTPLLTGVFLTRSIPSMAPSRLAAAQGLAEACLPSLVFRASK